MLEQQAAWRRGWHLRSIAWGWVGVALCCATVSAAAVLLRDAGMWRAVAFLGLVPVELAAVFASVTHPGGARGVPMAHPDIERLGRVLRVRADVRESPDAEMFGGTCHQRWGRDVIVVTTGDFSHHELLAVVAHEMGHTKQSAIAKAAWRPAKRMLWAAVWVWGLAGHWWWQAGGVVVGMALVAWLLFFSGVRLRVLAQLVAWGVWVWQLAPEPLWPLVAGAVTWFGLHLAQVAHSRVSELLADEAVRVLPRGPEALSSALARVEGPKGPWWRRALSTHPHPTSRGRHRSRRRSR